MSGIVLIPSLAESLRLWEEVRLLGATVVAVSYTHLTLPTILLV